MQAIPHVLGRIAGRETAGHGWPLGLTRLDRWENRRRTP